VILEAAWLSPLASSGLQAVLGDRISGLGVPLLRTGLLAVLGDLTSGLGVPLLRTGLLAVLGDLMSGLGVPLLRTGENFGDLNVGDLAESFEDRKVAEPGENFGDRKVGEWIDFVVTCLMLTFGEVFYYRFLSLSSSTVGFRS